MKDKRPYVDHAIDSVRRVIKVAEDYGIIYALEVVNRFEQWLCNDAKEALAFVDAVEGVGGTFNAAAGPESIAIRGQFLARDQRRHFR